MDAPPGSAVRPGSRAAEDTSLLENAPNFRDLGGTVTAKGETVRKGLLFRSEAMFDPTEADEAKLAQCGIALVCDLRTPSERAHHPNTYWRAAAVETSELDILADIRSSAKPWEILNTEPTAAGARRVMQGVYRELPFAAAPHLAVIFARIAQGNLPLLVHCTAGKDRTGFVCAMILYALGVPHEAVVADYLATNSRLSDRVRHATRRMLEEKVGASVPEAAITPIIGVERAYLEESLAVVDAEFGSLGSYLENQARLDSLKRDAVCNRLLEKER